MKAQQVAFDGRTRGVAESLEFMDALYGISKAEREAIEAMRGKLKGKFEKDN